MAHDKLDNLVKARQLKVEPATDDEVTGLLRLGTVRLADAKNESLSTQSRFDLAYNAAHALSLAALRRAGYRSQNRYLVFQCTQHTLDLASEYWRVLDQAGLAIVDVSIGFERFAQAPAYLQAVHRALATGAPGAYVMRYSDDTLRQTLHVFVIGDSTRIYVRLTTAYGEDVVQETFDILAAEYDEKTRSLILDTPAGIVRLTPQETRAAIFPITKPLHNSGPAERKTATS